MFKAILSLTSLVGKIVNQCYILDYRSVTWLVMVQNDSLYSKLLNQTKDQLEDSFIYASLMPSFSLSLPLPLSLSLNQPSLPTLFCSVLVYISVLWGPFNYISFHKFSRQLSAFSLCSSGLVSALLVLSTTYLFMKVSLLSLIHI